jgi:hypothetical protein
MDQEQLRRNQSSALDEENGEAEIGRRVSPSFGRAEEPRLSAGQNIEPALNRIDQTSRRLVVHSICLENFKSYQGVQTIGPFDDVRVE